MWLLGDFPVVQQLRIHPAMQGTQVWSLLRDLRSHMLEPSGIHILQDATKISCTTKTQHSQVNNKQIYIVQLFIFFKKMWLFCQSGKLEKSRGRRICTVCYLLWKNMSYLPPTCTDWPRLSLEGSVRKWSGGCLWGGPVDVKWKEHFFFSFTGDPFLEVLDFCSDSNK